MDGEHLGLLGLGLIVSVVALFRLPADWHAMWHQVINPAVPAGQVLGNLDQIIAALQTPADTGGTETADAR